MGEGGARCVSWHLFIGGGGGLLGSILAGWRTVAGVEIDPRCREIVFARQRDGVVEPFPIWDDVRTFDGRPWRGFVDIITGGFPCPLFSTARHGRGQPVDLWPDMLRIVRESEPPKVLAENVQRRPIERAALGLRGFGYHCVVLRAPASAVGAPHRRDRWFVAADTNGQAQHLVAEHAEMAGVRARARAVWDRDPRLDPDVVDGVARGLDVYPRAVGNGQVPQVVHEIARVCGWLT